jgi:hypothetical protein
MACPGALSRCIDCHYVAGESAVARPETRPIAGFKRIWLRATESGHGLADLNAIRSHQVPGRCSGISHCSAGGWIITAGRPMTNGAMLPGRRATQFTTSDAELHELKSSGVGRAPRR